jgi:hypothetical protein
LWAERERPAKRTHLRTNSCEPIEESYDQIVRLDDKLWGAHNEISRRGSLATTAEGQATKLRRELATAHQTISMLRGQCKQQVSKMQGSVADLKAHLAAIVMAAVQFGILGNFILSRWALAVCCVAVLCFAKSAWYACSRTV